MRTRRTLALGATAPLLFLAACGTSAEDPADYPSQNVDMIVPFGAGSGVDIAARALAPCLEAEWGQRVLVENREGGSGTVGTREVVNAQPDGYTLSVNTVTSSVVAPQTLEGIDYTVEDLQHFGLLTAAPILVIVPPDSPYETLDDLVEAGRNGAMAVSTAGPDSPMGVILEQLNTKHGTQFENVVNNVTNEMVRGVVEGDWDAAVTTTALDTIPRIDNGDVKVLAHGGTGDHEFLEGVETFEEQGYGDLIPSTEITLSLAAPTGIDAEVGSRIEDTLASCLEDPDVQNGLGEELTIPEFVDGETATASYEELSAAIAALQ